MSQESAAGVKLDPWLAENLVCPRDHGQLNQQGNELVCQTDAEHRYPVVDGIPVMLIQGVPITIAACARSLEAERLTKYSTTVSDAPASDSAVDPFVQKIIVGTHGLLYKSLEGNMKTYPIPEIPLPPGNERRLLDIGCNWGRWDFAAARRGYRVIGIDPNIDAVMAARRIKRQLGLTKIDHVVGDGRYLPFKNQCFDIVFSFGVLQHFAKEDARKSLAEAKRVVKSTGETLIQMANRYGLRNCYSLVRQKLTRDSGVFRVRYWGPKELMQAFSEIIGPSRMFADGFLTLNTQESDISMLPPRYRLVVRTSLLLRRISGKFSPLGYLADSLYFSSTPR